MPAYQQWGTHIAVDADTHGYATASLVWHGWTPHGNNNTHTFLGVLSVPDVPVRINLHVELTLPDSERLLPSGLTGARVKMRGLPPVDFEFKTPFTPVEVGSASVTSAILSGGKGSVFTGTVVSSKLDPETSRLGGLLLATWQVANCRWRRDHDDETPVIGPWLDDDEKNVTEVTEVTKASIDTSANPITITGQTESTAWSFERPSLMSVEPSPEELLEIRKNADLDGEGS